MHRLRKVSSKSTTAESSLERNASIIYQIRDHLQNRLLDLKMFPASIIVQLSCTCLFARAVKNQHGISGLMCSNHRFVPHNVTNTCAHTYINVQYIMLYIHRYTHNTHVQSHTHIPNVYLNFNIVFSRT